MQLQQIRDTAGKRFAEFHRLYVGSFTGDLGFYAELAAKSGGPVLEVGCATGRVVRHLASRGYPCLGIDTRREMLELARRELEGFEDHGRVADHDLRSAPLAERFSAALVTLYYFNALIDVEEQRRFLRHLHRGLESEAVLAMDLYCLPALGRSEDAVGWREIRKNADGRDLYVRDHREMLTPLLERRIQQFRVEPGLEGEVITHRRYLTPQQGTELLQEAGFEDIVWIRDYDLATAAPVAATSRPEGPFVLMARRG